MNWYLSQKEAWNWKSMLPSGGQKAPMQQKAPTSPDDSQRTRQQIETEKGQVMMQMNILRGPQRGTPGAEQKLQQLQQKFQQLLNESSMLHDMNFPQMKQKNVA